MKPVIEITGLVIETSGLVIEVTGLVIEITGLFIEVMGLVIEIMGLVIEVNVLLIEVNVLLISIEVFNILIGKLRKKIFNRLVIAPFSGCCNKTMNHIISVINPGNIPSNNVAMVVMMRTNL
jgi:hypothetical protein